MLRPCPFPSHQIPLVIDSSPYVLRFSVRSQKRPFVTRSSAFERVINDRKKTLGGVEENKRFDEEWSIPIPRVDEAKREERKIDK